MTSWTINPIGLIEGPFKEKFGVPRQSLLCPEIPGRIRMLAPYDDLDALDGLMGYSHLWLQFGFHLNRREDFSPKIRPPRLGGNDKVGVFASRSSFRPNSLGLSVVAFEGIEKTSNALYLRIRGHDLVNSTPIFDIKPYIARYDSHPAASEGWSAQSDFPVLTLSWEESALAQLKDLFSERDLTGEIESVIKLHPMPTYTGQDKLERSFGMSYQGLNIRWKVTDHNAHIIDVALEK